MINGLCHSGNWGSPGNLGVGGWASLILSAIFWVGLLAGVTGLVILMIRRARVRTAPASSTNTALADSGQIDAKAILQAQYARGEITREQYELRKKDF